MHFDIVTINQWDVNWTAPIRTAFDLALHCQICQGCGKYEIVFQAILLGFGVGFVFGFDHSEREEQGDFSPTPNPNAA